MESLISKSDVLNRLKELKSRSLKHKYYRAYMDAIEDVNDMISSIPTREPKTVGEWVESGTFCGIACSICGKDADDFCYSQDDVFMVYAPNYCPHCGASLEYDYKKEMKRRLGIK